jgi:hypothetical protein
MGKSGLFTIEILSFIHPAPGEIIHPSTNPLTPYTIEWSTSNPDAILFRLYYSFDNGATWNIVPGTKNKVPGFTFETPILPPDSGNKQCSLKIVGYNAKGKKVVEGISGRFLLEVLRVTDPNGGGSVQGGQPGSISWHLWEPVDPVQTVLLYYTLDGGVTWKKIASLSDPYTAQETLHTYNSFNWPIVTKPKTCKVKVVIKNDSGFTMGTDVSDDIFTINP